MAPTITDAIVLHAFDYLETSRILRLVTREAGVVSVLAKGARRNRGKYGSAVDLFAEGEAQLYLKPTRDLQTLASFDVTRSRSALALDMGRFLAASALSELVLRVGRDDPNPALYETVVATLDAIARDPADASVITTRALAGGWQIVDATGFAPSLDDCALCHAALAADTVVAFAHPAGGALCDRCARGVPATRRLPAEARAMLRGWMGGEETEPLSQRDARAHQRLLREFLHEHVTDDRPLRAFAAWESSTAGATSAVG